jgi:hypothetical protein
MKFSASKSLVRPHRGGCFQDSHAFVLEIKSKIEKANAPGRDLAQGVFKDAVQSFNPAGI